MSLDHVAQGRATGYTSGVPNSPAPDEPHSLRAEQVAQTRAALVAAGRDLFGALGFAATSVDDLARGFDAFLDAVLKPDLARIVIIDAPAVLGLARYTELDEQYAFAAIVATLEAAAESGQLAVADPQTLARLLLGALTRGAMLIANSAEPAKTRDEVSAAMRAMLAGFAAD